MDKELNKIEQQYLSLLLKNRDLVDIYQDGPLAAIHLSPQRRVFLHAIEDAFDKGFLLSRKTFLEYINKYISKKQERAFLEVEFNTIYFTQANRNDFPLLQEKIINSFLLKAVAENIKKFNEEKSKDIVLKIQELGTKLIDVSTGLRDTKNKIVYEDLVSLSDKHVQNIFDVREGKVEEAEFISYGIQELDYTSGVGLAPGTLTLFCGDVGGFKSTQMLNVSSHVWWDQKKNVLFVPLEMPESLIWNKWIARQTKIAFDCIANPKSLTDQQIVIIKEFIEKAKEHEAKFFLMDSYEQRTTVSLIRKMIEKNVAIFKPRVVVVDYIANLTSDKNISQRNDLEIGEMLKDLRYMGRPGVVHDEGFAIISGAQIGREALKRVRKSSNDKTAFYSEDLRGSHEYSADADCIYAQFPDPQQPDERLQTYVVKARYGKKTFPDGSKKAVFEIKPSISLIKSTADYYSGQDKSEILKKALDDDDFAFSAKSSDQPSAMTQDIDELFNDL